MSINLIDKENTCRLVFEGCLTYEFAREQEERITDALRRYSRFEVDLSGVEAIDLCGLHLLRMLESQAGEGVETLAGSPIVERAQQHLLSSRRTSWLR